MRRRKRNVLYLKKKKRGNEDNDAGESSLYTHFTDDVTIYLLGYGRLMMMQVTIRKHYWLHIKMIISQTNCLLGDSFVSLISEDLEQVISDLRWIILSN